MKILTATGLTQGQRASDFNWCVDGELVTHTTLICDRDRAEGADRGCGCGRSFGGLNSHRATTTAIVSDIDGFHIGDLAEAVHSYRKQAGWTASEGRREREQSLKIAFALTDLAAGHPPGTILERRLDDVVVRVILPDVVDGQGEGCP